MEKKEYYRINLPHFQQPGQAYFITWNLQDAVPKKAVERYSRELEILKSQLKAMGKLDDNLLNEKCESELLSPKLTSPEFENIKRQYYLARKKYLKAYHDLLDVEKSPRLNLTKPDNLKVIIDCLKFWTGKRLENYAFCIMPNHVHWVFRLFMKDEKKQPVYLQDILYSVKRFSANKINDNEGRKGPLWQKESFDTTIRDEKHLYYAIRYTINNPVSAGLVSDWKDWEGTWCDCPEFF